MTMMIGLKETPLRPLTRFKRGERQKKHLLQCLLQLKRLEFELLFQSSKKAQANMVQLRVTQQFGWYIVCMVSCLYMANVSTFSRLMQGQKKTKAKCDNVLLKKKIKKVITYLNICIKSFLLIQVLCSILTFFLKMFLILVNCASKNYDKTLVLSYKINI